MENLLISACLLGVQCRYDGGSKPVMPTVALMEQYHLIPICPEQLGGLPTPREPSERRADTFVSDIYPTEYMHLFHATGFTGTPKECDEGELAWIGKHALAALQQWEGDRIFLRLMDEHVPFFSLKLVYAGDTLTEAVLNGERIR